MQNEDAIVALLSNLLKQQEDLNKHIKDLGNKKDFWDKFGAVSTFISTVVIAFAGLYFTHLVDEQKINQEQRLHDQRIAQERLNHKNELELSSKQFEQNYAISQMETFQKFIPHLMSNANEREIAMIAISVSGQPEVTLRLEQIFKKWEESGGGRSVSNAIMTSSSVSNIVVSNRGNKAQSSSNSSKRDKYKGWVYLGQFSGSDVTNAIWKTRYLDFSEKELPQKLLGNSYVVRARTGALNVRMNMPTESGLFLGIVDVLNPGATLKIKQIQPWSSTDFFWAEVEYAK